jgi:hypothetical protein
MLSCSSSIRINASPAKRGVNAQSAFAALQRHSPSCISRVNGVDVRGPELGVDIKKDGPLNEKGEITWRWHPPATAMG